MEDLQAGRRFKDLQRKGIGKKAVGKQAQTGPDALAANGNHVAERVIQPGRFCLKFYLAKKVLQGLVNGALRNHGWYFLQI